VVPMNADSVVRARINGRIKEEASDILGAMGLTLSDAYRMLLIRVVEEKSLPFAPLSPNKKTIDAMREVRSGRLTRSKSVDDLMVELNARD
jgi:DNA-damage-inducible protein J